MKRIITALITTLCLVAFNTTALAATYWKTTISSPANTTNKSFNVQYTTSSTSADDDFSVELFQNGTSIGIQTTTKAYGDAGLFAVTVPAAGTYSYTIKATNSGDETPKNTGTVTVIVSEPPADTVNTVFVNNGTTNTSTTGGSAAGSSTAATAGQVAGAQAGASNGQVGTDGATTDNASQAGDVLGSEANKDADNKSSKTNPLWYIGGLALIAGAVFYSLRLRSANND